MDFKKLPDKDAKSLHFLAFSLLCFFLSSITSDSTIRITLCIIATASFVLAAIKFIKTDLFFPLIPCKERVEGNGRFICIREKGFYFGFCVSILAIFIIKKYQINFPLKNYLKNSSLLIGVIFSITTIVHGILRRWFGFLTLDNFFNNLLTFIVGFITGVGTLFLAISIIFL